MTSWSYNTVTHLPGPSKKPQKKKCVCTNPKECKELTKEFSKIGDVRGGFIVISKGNADSRKKHQFKVKQHIVNRYNVYLPTGRIIETYDNRSKDPTHQVTQENPTKKPVVVDSYVALHHFNPFCLSTMTKKDDNSNADKYKFTHTIDKKVANP